MKSRFVHTLFSICLLITLLSINGCGSKQQTQSVDDIPKYFITYIDDSDLFSISFPRTWSVDKQTMQEYEQMAKELLQSIDAGVPIETVSVLFLAGGQYEEGYSSSVSIGIEPVPLVSYNVDDYVDESTQYARAIASYYTEYSRKKITIDGKEAIICRYDCSVGDSPVVSFLDMQTVRRGQGWTVTCATITGLDSDLEADFQTILRSFRIHK